MDELRKGAVMLAEPSKTIHTDVEQAIDLLTATPGLWMFDEKLDGVRCVAIVEDGTVTLVNRRGVRINDRFPDVEMALHLQYPSGKRILDGEIVCFNEGKPDFARIQKRDKQAKVAAVAMWAVTYPATFVAFDLLSMGGDDHRNLPFRARRLMLEKEGANWGEGLAVVPCGEARELWQRVVTDGTEGIVAKRADGHYRAGRSSQWVKLKRTWDVSCIVAGYTPGTGSRSDTFGALRIALLDENRELFLFGEVGTGFTNAMIDDLKARVDAQEVLIIDVNVQNITKERKPRFPSYRGIRTDLTLLDCTVDQLAGIPVT